VVATALIHNGGVFYGKVFEKIRMID